MLYLYSSKTLFKAISFSNSYAKEVSTLGPSGSPYGTGKFGLIAI